MSVDAGLLALKRGSTREALAQWRTAIESGTADARPYLFSSQALMLEGALSGYPEAARLADRACALEPGWPEAWVLAGEWRVVAAINAGMRRTARQGGLFRLDAVLREQGELERVIECYGKAAELDDGRLGRILARCAGMWKTEDAPLRIFERAGLRAAEASGPSPLELLRRAGVGRVEPTPSDARLAGMLREARAEGGYCLVIPPATAFHDYAELFRAEGLPGEPVPAARSAEWLEEWHARSLAHGVALVAPAAVAYNPIAWFSERAPAPVRVWWLGAEALTLGECLGGLCRSSPGAREEAASGRRWFAGRLVLER